METSDSEWLECLTKGLKLLELVVTNLPSLNSRFPTPQCTILYTHSSQKLSPLSIDRTPFASLKPEDRILWNFYAECDFVYDG